MKLNKILVLSAVFALSACGGTPTLKAITQEEAAAKAEAIAAAQANIEIGDFSLVDEVSMIDPTYGAIGQKTVRTLDLEASYLYQAQISTIAGYEFVTEVTYYIQDGSLYGVYNEEGVKSYEVAEIPSSLSSYSFVEIMEMLGANPYEGMDFFCDVMLSEEAINNLYAGFTEEGLAELGCTSGTLEVKSKGEGSLYLKGTFGMDYSEEGYSINGTMIEEYEWENNLVTKYSTVMDITETYGEEEMVSYMAQTQTFSYDVTGTVYPDLSEYTLVQPE